MLFNDLFDENNDVESSRAPKWVLNSPHTSGKLSSFFVMIFDLKSSKQDLMMDALFIPALIKGAHCKQVLQTVVPVL